MSDVPFDVLLREKLAHIDLMLAQHNKEQAHLDLMLRHNKEQAHLDLTLRLPPWALVFSGMTTGAALMAAAFALGRLIK